MRRSGSHVQPVILGDNARALRIAGCLQSQGFDVSAIRPPSVPEGTARLRLTLNVNPQQIEDCFVRGRSELFRETEIGQGKKSDGGSSRLCLPLFQAGRISRC